MTADIKSALTQEGVALESLRERMVEIAADVRELKHSVESELRALKHNQANNENTIALVAQTQRIMGDTIEKMATHVWNNTELITGDGTVANPGLRSELEEFKRAAKSRERNISVLFGIMSTIVAGLSISAVTWATHALLK